MVQSGIERRVLIVADDPLARAGLAALLADRSEGKVVGQVPANARLANEVALHRPDVVVWDLGWSGAPDGRSPSRLELLAETAEDTPTIALVPDEALAAEAWRAGARGLLPREAAGTSLASAIVAASHGLIVVDPTLAAAVLAPPGREPDLPGPELTPREREVLQLLADGMPNKAIARRLNISEHTVKFHVNAVLGKLGAQSRTEAVVRATRLGLVIL